MKSQYFKPFLDQHIASFLAKHGFRRKGSTWNRRTDGIVHMIDFQLSKSYSAGINEDFTINVGVGVDSVSGAIHGKIPAFFKDWDCVTHERIGFMKGSNERLDRWWSLTTEADNRRVAEDVFHHLGTVALPALNQIESFQDVKNFIIEVESHRPKATMDPYIRLAMAVLCFIMGDQVEYENQRDKLLCGQGLKYGLDLWHDRMMEVATRLEAGDRDSKLLQRKRGTDA